MEKNLYEELKEIAEKTWDEGELESIRPYNMEDLEEIYGGRVNDILRNIDYKNFNYYHDFFTIDDLGHIRSFISYKDHILKYSEEILDVYTYSNTFDKKLYNQLKEYFEEYL